MKIICPNLKNKEVAREFEELKNATSEAAAYHIWSQNNGNGIDKAPNGEPSKLFSDLLEHYNGDRVAAIQAKARTYSKSFKEWFGESKVVDKNGEPLVVYHGGASGIDTFYNMKDNPNYENTKHQGYSIQNRVGIYFSRYLDVAKNYKKPYGRDGKIYPVFLSIKNPKNVSFTETLKNRLIRFGTLGLVKKSTIDEISENELETLYSDYDGVNHSSGTEFVVFSSNQIKSIDNQGTFSIQDNNIYNQKIVSRETRLENFYNSYVKLRTKTVEKAENETELRKRRSKLSSNSKLHETNLDAIMQEILGIYIYDADYSTTDSTLRELNNLSESRYLTLLNEEIDKLDRLLIPVDSLIAAVNNINKGYNKLSDYSKEVQDRLFNMPVYREATELPVITRAKR